MREFSVSMADYERWTVEQDEKNNGGDKPSVNIHIYTQADHPVCTAAAAALHTWPGIIMLMLENEVSHETKQHTHTHSLDSVTVSVIFFFSVFAFLHLARTAFVRSFTGNGRACVISGFMFRAIITWCTFLYIYFVSLYPSFFSVCLGVGCCSWMKLLHGARLEAVRLYVAEGFQATRRWLVSGYTNLIQGQPTDFRELTK